jgi:hypothetical protein
MPDFPLWVTVFLLPVTKLTGEKEGARPRCFFLPFSSRRCSEFPESLFPVSLLMLLIGDREEGERLRLMLFLSFSTFL